MHIAVALWEFLWFCWEGGTRGGVAILRGGGRETRNSCPNAPPSIATAEATGHGGGRCGAAADSIVWPTLARPLYFSYNSAQTNWKGLSMPALLPLLSLLSPSPR